MSRHRHIHQSTPLAYTNNQIYHCQPDQNFFPSFRTATCTGLYLKDRRRGIDMNGVIVKRPGRRDEGRARTVGDKRRYNKVDVWLLVSDFFITISSLWTAALIRVLTYEVFNGGEVLRWIIYILTRFLFAWLGNITDGGDHHPLIVIASATSGGLSEFHFGVVLRILVQVVGSTVGVWQVRMVFSEVIGKGPLSNVGIPRGVLTEGLLSFMMVIGYLGLDHTAPIPFVKICMMSILELTLGDIGSDLTGSSMNPAEAFAWAFYRGVHKSKEQVWVYLLAPLKATILAIWAFRMVSVQKKKKWK